MATLKEILSTKTDSQLKYYLEHVDKHTSEGVRTALIELKKRNIQLPEDIDQQIEEKIRLIENAKYNSTIGRRRNIVVDADAPEYYSQIAIYGFSILFSLLFGAVLMAINLKNSQKQWAWSIVFGLGFTGAFILLGQFLPSSSTGLSLIVNAIGVTIMHQIFWNKHIGKDTKYRAKPIWIPLVIGIILMIPFIYFTTRG